MRKSRDLTGIRNGRVTVLDLAFIDANRKRIWNCVCDCGTRFQTTTANLIPKHTVSCGCYKADLKRREHSYLNNLFKNYRRNAKARGLNFELTKDQVESLSKGQCHYCGVSPTRIYRSAGNSNSFPTHGIDRVDNEIGYLYMNCVSCCEQCNFMKGDYTVGEFIERIKAIYKYSVPRES